MNNIVEILNAFIIQSGFDEKLYGPGGQVVKPYPKEFMDLKMGISFGQGSPARVPWISFLAPEMRTMEGFYPVYLFYKKSRKLILSYGVSETKEAKTSWPEEILNNCKKIQDYLEKPPRYLNSFVFKTYTPSIQGKEVKYVDDNNKPVSNDILTKDLIEIINYYKKTVDVEIKKEDSPIGQGLFHLEKVLEAFIIENWDRTEFGKKYDLIYEDEKLISKQYQTDVGPIDILARDKKTKNYVVIELKKDQTSDDTVGQLTRYMGWIKKNKKDDGVKGIIIAGRFDDRLDHARIMIPNCEVFLYDVLFKLSEYKK